MASMNLYKYICYRIEPVPSVTTFQRAYQFPNTFCLRRWLIHAYNSERNN